MASSTLPTVLVRRLGRVKYKDALHTQQTWMEGIVNHITKESDTRSTVCPQDTVFLCEHDPVYTNGRRAKGLDHEQLSQRFKSIGADYFQVERGGLITFHGPGQLVCYPVINLNNFRPSLRWYVNLLEEAVIKTCETFGVETHRTPDTGIWVGPNKICAMGIQSTRHVTMHGLALNCNTDLQWFNHIVPCGLHGKGVTSLTEQTGKAVTIEEATGPFLSSLAEALKCNLVTSCDT